MAIAAYVGVGYGPPDPASTQSASPAAKSESLTPSAAPGEQNQSTLGARSRATKLCTQRSCSPWWASRPGATLPTRSTVCPSPKRPPARRGLAIAGAVTVLNAAERTLDSTRQTVELLAAEAAAPVTTAPQAGAPTSTSSGPAGPSPTILGPPVLTGSELAGWFASTGHKANITVPMSELAADYAAEGKATGVRDDLAFAQSIVETGYFSFPSYGQLTPADNNFAGIGACDSCSHGWRFPNAKTGVGAQLELLEAYATPKPIPTPLIGPVGVGGCCATWTSLAGTWASSPTYGIAILIGLRPDAHLGHPPRQRGRRPGRGPAARA